MSDDEIIRRLIMGAYEMGWTDACFDFRTQTNDSQHPIGASRRNEAGGVIAALDPNNLLGLNR